MDAAADKKAEDVLLLDVGKLSIFADYFVLASGTSERQIDAIAEGIVEQARKQLGAKPRTVEGNAAHGWVLIDFRDVVVHVFAPEKRRYYDLEALWRDAKVVVRVQ